MNGFSSSCWRVGGTAQRYPLDSMNTGRPECAKNANNPHDTLYACPFSLRYIYDVQELALIRRRLPCKHNLRSPPWRLPPSAPPNSSNTEPTIQDTSYDVLAVDHAASSITSRTAPVRHHGTTLGGYIRIVYTLISRQSGSYINAQTDTLRESPTPCQHTLPNHLSILSVCS